MAIAGCDCKGKLGNTGYPNLKPFGVTRGLYMVPLVADDGIRNGLDLASTTLGADLLARVNNPDPSKRFYPYQNLNNVLFTEADAEYQTADNGERFKLRDGIKTVTFESWGVTEQFFDKTSGACVEMGLVLVDVCQNVKGEKEGDMLYPRAVNQNSFDAKFMEATNTQQPMVMFQMDYDLISNDGDQWMIPASEFGTIKPLKLKGMIDVVFTLVDVVDATNFVVDAQFEYGSAVDAESWKGGLLADFTLYDVTADAAVALSTVVESATVPGRYTVTTSTAITLNNFTTVDAFRAAATNSVNGFEGEELTFDYDF